jgi:hypothetical protein
LISDHKSKRGSNRSSLRLKTKLRRPISTRHWQELSPNQKPRYRKALNVLSQVRNGESYSSACAQQHIGRKTARKYLGKALYRKGNRIKAHKEDRLFRNLQINENGKIAFIELNRSTEATKVALYHQAVKTYLENGELELLLSFKDQGVVDSAGVFHVFETRPKVLVEINERREDEYYEIYNS